MPVAVIRVRDQLSEVWIRHGLVFLFVVYVNIVESNEIQKVGLVDHTQAEELADARFGDTILQLGQPPIRNTESLIAFDVGDSAARPFNFANRYVALVTKVLKGTTRGHSNPRKCYE